MSKRVLAFVVVILALAATAFAQKTNIDWDRSANFAEFHTYAWEPSPHPAQGFWNQRIVDAVNRELQAKGLKMVDSNPDLWVVYSKSIHDQKQVVGTSYGFGPGWYWGGWGPNTVNYNTYVTKQGTLVVEIADAKDHQLMWRGSVTDTLSDNSNRNISKLDKAVAKLFRDYPPKQKQ
jgi:hypothetical protein